MLTCRDATRLSSEKLDRPLTRWQRLQLYLHLAICSHCRRFSYQLAFLQRAVRIWTEKSQKKKLSDQARIRICQEIQREAESEKQSNDQ